MEVKEKEEKCEHRDMVFSHSVRGEVVDDFLVDVYRCLECNQLVNVYIPNRL